MRRAVTVVTSCLLALGLVACGNTRTIRYETEARTPKRTDFPIEILDSVNLTRPYKVIGVVQANAGKLHDPNDTIEALKAEARKLGGEALLDLQQGAARGGVIRPVGGGAYAYGNVREIWSAKVIVWTQADGSGTR